MDMLDVVVIIVVPIVLLLMGSDTVYEKFYSLLYGERINTTVTGCKYYYLQKRE